MGQVGHQSSNFFLSNCYCVHSTSLHAVGFVELGLGLHTMSQVVTIFGRRYLGCSGVGVSLSSAESEFL